jgi:transcriptional regulator of arginine metabolism
MKLTRQTKILEIIKSQHIETQEELLEELKKNDIVVTQATVSRDIKELKLIKASDGKGGQHYVPFKDLNTLLNDRIVTVFAESVLSVDYAENMIVLRTLPAMAQAAALAIDSIDWDEIVGTIGGDDTIFVIVRYRKDVIDIANRFKKMMK